jgi:hypothetical protein
MEIKICIKKLPAPNLEYYFNIFVEELKRVAKSFRIFGVSGNIRISSFQNIKEQLQRWYQNSRWRRFEWQYSSSSCNVLEVNLVE